MSEVVSIEFSIEDKKQLVAGLEKKLDWALKLLKISGELAGEVKPVIEKIQKNEVYTLKEVEEAQKILCDLLKMYRNISAEDFEEINYLRRLKSEIEE